MTVYVTNTRGHYYSGYGIFGIFVQLFVYLVLSCLFTLAKHNVERYYAVVGVLEKWKETLDVLEAYVPAYYKGAKEIYKKFFKDQPKNKNFLVVP